MGLLYSSFVPEPISHENLILLGKYLTYFSQRLKETTGNEVGLRLHFWITKLSLTNFKMKVELPLILLSYPRLTLRIFTAHMFHTIAGASSIIFYLCWQFFCRRKKIWIRKAGHLKSLLWYFWGQGISIFYKMFL